MKVFSSQLTDQELLLVLRVTGQRDLIGLDIDEDKKDIYLSKLPLQLRHKLLLLDAEFSLSESGAEKVAG